MDNIYSVVTDYEITRLAQAIRNKLEITYSLEWPYGFISALNTIPEPEGNTDNFKELIAGTCSYLSDNGIHKLLPGGWNASGAPPYRYLFDKDNGRNKILEVSLPYCFYIGNEAMPYCQKYNLPRCERVDYGGCRDATQATMLLFSSLSWAGKWAFSQAGWNSYISLLSFSKLEYAGSECFAGMWLSAYNSQIYFPNLKTIDTGGFSEIAINTSISPHVTIYLPKIKEIYEDAFWVCKPYYQRDPDKYIYIGTSDCQLQGNSCFGPSDKVKIFVLSSYYNKYLSEMGSHWAAYSDQLFSF